MTLSLLVIDDDESIRDTLAEFFETFGYTTRTAGTSAQGRQMAAEHAPDVVLLDLRLPDADGLEALQALRADDPDLGVVLLSGFTDVRTAVRAMHLGASDVLEKPVDLELLARSVRRAAELGRIRRELDVLRAKPLKRNDSKVESPPGFDAAAVSMIELAVRNADAPVLIQGETGTGKSYVARQIHDRSARNRSPFVEVNCSSLSPTFFETELFGYERGAFTDAKNAKRGLFEVAGEGTVFLDEIADASMEVQPRLLKVIEEGTFRRLGGTTTLRSSARVIVASHQPLDEAVAARRFRADLFYRLQVLTVMLPPLRATPDRIEQLASTLMTKGASLSPEALIALEGYPWPGNIRELKNTLWRAAILADGKPIQPAHLGLPQLNALPDPQSPPNSSTTAPQISSATPSLRTSERAAIAAALKSTGGNRSKAARQLGIARSTLLEKLKRYPELS
jgi:DNA-binding NtrC family response regulator